MEMVRTKTCKKRVIDGDNEEDEAGFTSGEGSLCECQVVGVIASRLGMVSSK